MGTHKPHVTVIGGGLAGCEASWQLAQAGIQVTLVDMKPLAVSPAHQTPLLCELVCSNSLRSDDVGSPAGLLKHELRAASSLVVACADANKVPAGSALAVERVGFSRAVTVKLAAHPNIRLERRIIDAIPDGPTIIATGPLTGGRLAREVKELFGGERLYFYDAIAPIVTAESIDASASFRGSRWDRHTEEDSGGDYINCPMDRETYEAFVAEIRNGRKVVPHDFEQPKYFEGCLPIEVMAERGFDALRFGPMRPVGLTDPRTGIRPYAVIQLRPENRYLTSYNLVGFQTRLAYPEQKRIFSMIPALAAAEFVRFGSIHRNTYIDSPALLDDRLRLKSKQNVSFAGLITGVEGYIESCAMGLLVGLFVGSRLNGAEIAPPPPTTAMGGLYHHVTRRRGPGQAFTPTNVNFGLIPPLQERIAKRDRKRLMAERAMRDVSEWLKANSARAA